MRAPKGYQPVRHFKIDLKRDFLYMNRLITKVILVFAWSFSEEVWRTDQVIGIAMEPTKHDEHKHSGKRIPMSSYRERDGKDVKERKLLAMHAGARSCG